MSMQLSSELTGEAVRELSESRGEPAWLRDVRLEAFESIEELEFPEVIRTPGRLWTNLDELDYDTLVEPVGQSSVTERETTGEVEVLSFVEALEKYEDRVREHFGSVISPDENRLVALSTALFSSGTVIVVPEGVDAEAVKIRTTMESRSLFDYTLVLSEKSSSVTILERQDSAGDVDGHRYYSGIVEIVGGENSFVQYGSLQELSEETYNFSVKRGNASTYAQVNFIEGNIGSRLTKTTVGTELAGDGSETQIVGAFYGHNDQHFDLDSRVWHQGEHTTADLVTRGVIDDEARSVYEGTQVVGTEAWDTSSYQRENTLMLSDESEADASPKLIINNHDTEASHSATVGQIDQEDLLYMMTRGVPAGLATNMLVEGFFVPVLEEVAVDELRTDLEQRISQRVRL